MIRCGVRRRRSVGGVAQPVADARLGDQVLRPRRVGLELGPDVGDVDAQVVGLLRRTPGPTPRAAAGGGSPAAPGAGRARARRSNSIGVRWTSSPAAHDPPVEQVDHELADPQLRAAAGVGRPPHHRAQAGQQLVGAERLGDVIVGAGVERSDLLALVADRRQHEDRQPAAAPHLLADLDSRARREARGRAPARRAAGSTSIASASRLGLGRLDRVAGARAA